MNFLVRGLTIINSEYKEADDFFIMAHCEIMEIGGKGGEAFLVNVVSPVRLKGLIEVSDGQFHFEFGRGLFITNNSDNRLIINALQKLINGINAKSWDDLFLGITKYFEWI